MKSHTNCDHPKTPAGRRACRSANGVGGTTFHSYNATDVKGKSYTPTINPQDVKATTPAPVRRARLQSLQNRLSVMGDAKYDRVPQVLGGTGKSCIQAELHTGKGKCACGWEGK